MAEQLVPILKVSDTGRSAQWYARLGFTVEFEQRYSDQFPGYSGLRRGDVRLHLSERAGDATPDTLIFFFVEDVDPVAKEFGVETGDREDSVEVHLTDPDGNRIRVGAWKHEGGPVEEAAGELLERANGHGTGEVNSEVEVSEGAAEKDDESVQSPVGGSEDDFDPETEDSAEDDDPTTPPTSE